MKNDTTNSTGAATIRDELREGLSDEALQIAEKHGSGYLCDVISEIADGSAATTRAITWSRSRTDGSWTATAGRRPRPACPSSRSTSSTDL